MMDIIALKSRDPKWSAVQTGPPHSQPLASKVPEDLQAFEANISVCLRKTFPVHLS